VPAVPHQRPALDVLPPGQQEGVPLVHVSAGVQLAAEIVDKLAGLIGEEIADERGQVRDGLLLPSTPGLRVQHEARRSLAVGGWLHIR
jgi:hypothetical protein